MKSFYLISFFFIHFATAQASTQVLDCSFPGLSNDGRLLVALDQLQKPDQVSLNYDHFTDYEGEGAAI